MRIHNVNEHQRKQFCLSSVVCFVHSHERPRHDRALCSYLMIHWIIKCLCPSAHILYSAYIYTQLLSGTDAMLIFYLAHPSPGPPLTLLQHF